MSVTLQNGRYERLERDHVRFTRSRTEINVNSQVHIAHLRSIRAPVNDHRTFDGVYFGCDSLLFETPHISGANCPNFADGSNNAVPFIHERMSQCFKNLSIWCFSILYENASIFCILANLSFADYYIWLFHHMLHFPNQVINWLFNFWHESNNAIIAIIGSQCVSFKDVSSSS